MDFLCCPAGLVPNLKTQSLVEQLVGFFFYMSCSVHVLSQHLYWVLPLNRAQQKFNLVSFQTFRCYLAFVF